MAQSTWPNLWQRRVHRCSSSPRTNDAHTSSGNLSLRSLHTTANPISPRIKPNPPLAFSSVSGSLIDPLVRAVLLRIWFNWSILGVSDVPRFNGNISNCELTVNLRRRFAIRLALYGFLLVPAGRLSADIYQWEYFGSPSN